MRKVLVISPHPDDETLGCGGTLLKHGDRGDDIYWLIMTGASVKDGWPADFVEKRDREIDTVSRIYKFKQTFKLNYPTTKLDTVPVAELVGEIAKVIKKIEPNVIYLPNRSDVHTDHQITFKAALSCTKPFRFPFLEKVLMYETLSETDFAVPIPGNTFIPNVFIGISDYIEKKLEIMQVYESEVMDDPLPRGLSAIRALARLRGSRISGEYAEAFALVMEIE